MYFLIIGIVFIIIGVILTDKEDRSFKDTLRDIIYGIACIMIFCWIKSLTLDKISIEEKKSTEIKATEEIDTVINKFLEKETNNDTLYIYRICKQTQEN
jgi:hypothetical protein